MDKSLIQYLLKRIVFVAVILCLCNFFYVQFFYQKDLENEGWLMLKANKVMKQKADVLFLSASPNAALAPYDTDKRSISQMTEDLNQKYNVVAFDTGAIHAQIFLDYLKWIPTEKLPKIVVCNLNLRSFGIGWIHSGLENSLQRNRAYWSHYPALWTRISVALKNYEWIPDKERNEHIMAHYRLDYLPLKAPKNNIARWFQQLQDANYGSAGITGEYIKTFGFQIDKKNMRVKQYDAIVRFCKQHQIKLIFVLLSENIEDIRLKCGVDFADLMYQNTQFLENRYKQNAIVINNLDKIPNASFYEQGFPTEHYDAKGRLFTAETINTVLNDISRGSK